MWQNDIIFAPAATDAQKWLVNKVMVNSGVRQEEDGVGRISLSSINMVCL